MAQMQAKTGRRWHFMSSTHVLFHIEDATDQVGKSNK